MNRSEPEGRWLRGKQVGLVYLRHRGDRLNGCDEIKTKLTYISRYLIHRIGTGSLIDTFFTHPEKYSNYIIYYKYYKYFKDYFAEKMAR